MSQAAFAKDKQLALLALMLVGIAPTISILTGFALKAGIIAVIVFIILKIWIFVLPSFWHLKIDQQQISWSKPENGGFMVATGLGLGMVVVIVAAYLLLGNLMDEEMLYLLLEPVGLTVAWKLGLAILFWVFINSVLEEYVFRWFITSKAEMLLSGKWKPIFLSAAIFTLHHTIALSFFISPLGTLIGSFGVFVGGSIFSWVYVTYRSVWVAWITHALADVAIFAIAWHLVIG
ncbi:MAG: CPBP family glutamic-type intramembrane protease, partial [Candidatus Poseidoniaceae archaeon]|jgi:membrane protease YdiL (CAAX protease family)